jgi:hypothetical protein
MREREVDTPSIVLFLLLLSAFVAILTLRAHLLAPVDSSPAVGRLRRRFLPRSPPNLRRSGQVSDASRISSVAIVTSAFEVIQVTLISPRSYAD